MKKIYILFLSLSMFCACDDENADVFDVSIPESNIKFEPIPGGAIMQYKFPKNADIYGLQVKYIDCVGREIVMTGTYLSKELILKGFIEEESNVPIEIRLLSSDQKKSELIKMEFATKQCGARALFNDIKIEPYWAGFRLKYNGPKKVDGFINIGYIGINPKTKLIDTLLLQTELITEGKNTLFFANVVGKDNKVDAVVWTEDYRGNRVRKEVFSGIVGIKSEKMSSAKFTLEGSSQEDKNRKVGKEFLFDGDTKGIEALRNVDIVYDGYERLMYNFISGVNAVPGDWILDIGEEKVLSSVRIYAPLHNNRVSYGGRYWYGNLYSPNNVIIYGSQDKLSWTQLGEYKQSPNIFDESRWNFPLYDPNSIYTSVEQLEKADSCYMSVNFDFIEIKYRYLKINVVSTFPSDDDEGDGRVSFSEIEVYIKK